MRQDDKEAFQKIIGCHPGCVPELLLEEFLRISKKLRQALRWDILRNLNGQPKPSEQDIHEETIQRLLALMEAYEHAKLAIDYRLENWGKPYDDPYFDIQTLWDLRLRALAWSEGNTFAFLGQRSGAAHLSAEQSRRRKKRARPKGPLRHAVERICTTTSAASLDDLLDSMEDGEFIEDLFHSTKDPIHVIDIEVDHEKQEVRYRTRRQDPSIKPKSVTFERLKNILREIHKTRP
jgi:hypothetical protein